MGEETGQEEEADAGLALRRRFNEDGAPASDEMKSLLAEHEETQAQAFQEMEQTRVTMQTEHLANMQSKDHQLHSNNTLLQCKDAIIQLKDNQLRSKDELLQAKDAEILRLCEDILRLRADLPHGRAPSISDGSPPSPIDSTGDGLNTSTQRGISFGGAVNLSARAASPAFLVERDSSVPDAAHDDANLATLPTGTKIQVRRGPYEGRSGVIIEHAGLDAGLDYYKLSLKWVRTPFTLLTGDFIWS